MHYSNASAHYNIDLAGLASRVDATIVLSSACSTAHFHPFAYLGITYFGFVSYRMVLRVSLLHGSPQLG